MYCFDTNVFINSWRTAYPPDVFSSFWEKIDSLIRKEMVIAPTQVLSELQRGGDDLFTWVKEREHIFVETDEHIEEVVSDIVNTYRDRFLPKTVHDGIWADPYVIALAKAKNGIVVTQEALVGPNQTKIKIPNVCVDLGIKYINTIELIRREGWTF
ncbi:DUF4411 family protein [Alicyclobacillus herbarius]|uniref:DUF4411 family protein n=1 Tax=Alicyclobacillus herbarius TaxID=122960 RepID=UPI0004795ABE|nr:DUF4411 family protein [Alicyclobacillus herbarius]